MKLRTLLAILLAFAVATDGYARGAEDETLGDKIKKIFVRPTPKPRKKRRSSSKKKVTPTPTPAESPSASPSATPSSSTSATPTQTPPWPTATPTPSPEAIATPYPAQSPRSRPHAPMFEPVRPINPGPNSRKRVEAPPPGVTIPSPPPLEPTPMPVLAPTPSPSPTPTPAPKKKSTAPASVSANEIADYENYPPHVRKVLDLALGLTTQNLSYKYGSADPKRGGMDCSGFIHYVAAQSGVKDPPRDAREQYAWVRKAGTFQAVLGHRDESFELDGLKPGDLLFWSAAYSVDQDPAITETMIYLGRDKATNQRLMVGASDGRAYKGQKKLGVSVLDFKIARPKTDDRSGPIFVGYGRIPGLPGQ